jgi:PTH2 family peptidyl-tRNA hydrolase
MKRIGEPVKQVIVMRTDLNMRKGKMIAQGAHAAIGCFLGSDISVERLAARSNTISASPAVFQWLTEGMKKICVRTDSEEELLSIHAEAEAAGLVSFLVTDAGHTEFNGPTNTCIAIGPASDVAIDRITGHLKLL